MKEDVQDVKKKKDIKDINKWKPEEHPVGAHISEAGNAREYDTGAWRSQRPVRDPEKCTQCLICYMYCPDSAVRLKNDKVTDFDLKHCKGCGICAKECPFDAIEMVDEASALKKGGK